MTTDELGAGPVAPDALRGSLEDLRQRTAKAAYGLRVMADKEDRRGERGRLHAKAEGVSLVLSYIAETINDAASAGSSSPDNDDLIGRLTDCAQDLRIDGHGDRWADLIDETIGALAAAAGSPSAPPADEGPVCPRCIGQGCLACDAPAPSPAVVSPPSGRCACGATRGDCTTALTELGSACCASCLGPDAHAPVAASPPSEAPQEAWFWCSLHGVPHADGEQDGRCKTFGPYPSKAEAWVAHPLPATSPPGSPSGEEER